MPLTIHPHPSYYFLEMGWIPILTIYSLVFKVKFMKNIIDRFDKIASLNMHSISIIAD